MYQGVYTVKDIAKILRVSEKTVYALVQDNEIKCIRVRGQIRITTEQLDCYLRGGTNNDNQRETTER